MPYLKMSVLLRQSHDQALTVGVNGTAMCVSGPLPLPLCPGRLGWGAQPAAPSQRSAPTPPRCSKFRSIPLFCCSKLRSIPLVCCSKLRSNPLVCCSKLRSNPLFCSLSFVLWKTNIQPERAGRCHIMLVPYAIYPHVTEPVESLSVSNHGVLQLQKLYGLLGIYE